MVRIKYCAHCGESLHHPTSLLNEYWEADKTIYFCYCHSCHWRGEIVEIFRVIGVDIEESHE